MAEALLDDGDTFRYLSDLAQASSVLAVFIVRGAADERIEVDEVRCFALGGHVVCRRALRVSTSLCRRNRPRGRWLLLHGSDRLGLTSGDHLTTTGTFKANR
jgi:hypothetical protein